MPATVTGDNVVLDDASTFRVKEIAGWTGGLDESSMTHDSVYDVRRTDGGAFPTIAQMYAAVVARAPTTFNGMAANSIKYREDEGTNHFLFTVGYNTKPAEATLRWRFDTSGGTVRMFTSKNTTRYAATGRTAPDFKGAIGVKNTGKDAEPEGVDVVTPVLKLTATYKFPKDTVDFAYMKLLAGLTGRTNDDTFYTFEAGELLFLGAQGEIVPGIPTEVVYEWAASMNATGLSIGDIASIAKKGHEYLWVAFESSEDTSAKKLVQRPLAAYVERVYDEGDFSTMGIGTA